MKLGTTVRRVFPLVMCVIFAPAFAEGPLFVGGLLDNEGAPYRWNPANFPLIHISFLNPAWEPSDVRHHLYSCGYERDEDALEVETQWVRNKTSPFSSLLMPR